MLRSSGNSVFKQRGWTSNQDDLGLCAMMLAYETLVTLQMCQTLQTVCQVVNLPCGLLGHRGVIRVSVRSSSSLQSKVSNALHRKQCAYHMSVTVAVHSAYLFDIAESDFTHVCCLVELIRGSVAVGSVAEEVSCGCISDQYSGAGADNHADDHDLGVHLRQLLWTMPSLNGLQVSCLRICRVDVL